MLGQLESLQKMNSQMIILAHRSGDHCNRLFQSLHYHAYCLEHGIYFWNPTLIGMLRRQAVSMEWIGDLINRSINHVLRRFEKIFGFSPILDAPRTSTPLQMVGGWNYRCHHLTEKYRQQLSACYQLRIGSLSTLEKQHLAEIAAMHSAHTLVVGVHVRRGDYLDWMGGRYFYDDTVYQRYIQEIRDFFAAQGISCIIVVCTNDSKRLDLGQDHSTGGSWVFDQLVLQTCDMIVGPPSTFSLWASYISSTPYIHIEDPTQAFNLSSAQICPG